jgi:hypothetical protein
MRCTLLRVEDIEGQAPPGAPATPVVRIPWVPVMLAGLASAVALASLTLWLLAIGFVLQFPSPRGVTVIEPTGAEVTRMIALRVGRLVVAVALLVVTWRSGSRGHSKECWWAATATVIVGIGPSFF